MQQPLWDIIANHRFQTPQRKIQIHKASNNSEVIRAQTNSQKFQGIPVTLAQMGITASIITHRDYKLHEPTDCNNARQGYMVDDGQRTGGR
eukprot:9178725-Ditylum_brightwellii.AAC.1